MCLLIGWIQKLTVYVWEEMEMAFELKQVQQHANFIAKLQHTTQKWINVEINGIVDKKSTAKN